MKVVALMMVKNEEWILEYSMSVAMQWVDEIVVLDHDSTDKTSDIIKGMTKKFPGRIHSLKNSSRDWPEMYMRQMMLNKGREIKGTHFAIIDADESITANLKTRIRSLFRRLRLGEALDLRMIPAWRSPTQYRVDPCIWTSAKIGLGWRDMPGIEWSPKNGYHLHSRLPRQIGLRCKPITPGGVIHFQFADHERLKWKHRWYKLHEAWVYKTKSIRKIDENYNQALNEDKLVTREMPVEWRWTKLESKIQVGLPSWHIAACKEMYNKVKRIGRLHGLDLWGWKG